MNYCKECGEKVVNSAVAHCTNCGEPLPDATGGNGDTPDIKTVSSPSRQKRTISKKQKRSILIGVATLAILSGLYFVGAFFTSPERLINSFEEAVNEQDADKLAELITFHGSEKDITNEDVKGLLVYLDENPDKSQAIIESLQKQFAMLNGNKEVPSNMEGLLDMFMSSDRKSVV